MKPVVSRASEGGRLVVVMTDAQRAASVVARLASSSVVINEPAGTASWDSDAGTGGAAEGAVAAARQAEAEEAEAREVIERLERARREAGIVHEELSSTLAELRTRMAATPGGAPPADVAFVRQALALYDASGGASPPDRAAVEMADTLEELGRRAEEIAATEPGPASPDDLESAAQLLEGTAELVTEMELQASKGSVTDEQRAAIDAALQAAVDAESEVTGRFAGAAKRRAAEARQHLNEELAKAGFESFLDFLVAGHTVEAANDQRVEAARLQHKRAKEALQRLQDQGEPSAARQRVNDQRRRLLRQGADLLGFAPTVPTEVLLRSQPEVDPQATVNLVTALTGAGVALGDQPLRVAATSWLAGCEAARRERASVEAELAVAEAQFAAADAGGAGAWDALIDAAAVVLDQATYRVQVANQLVVSLQRAAGHGDQRGEVATGGEAAATASAAPPEERLQMWRQMAPAGATLVLVDPFDTLEDGVAEGVADLAADRTVVYVTGRQSILDALLAVPVGPTSPGRRAARPLVASRRPLRGRDPKDR